MKLTKKECRRIADIITNEELQQMFESARNNINSQNGWDKLSDSMSKSTKGRAWNILASEFNVRLEYCNSVKFSMLQEFGEYIPAHLKTYKDYKKPEKKEKKIVHEEPIFNSDNNETYYTECMRLLNKLLHLKYGNVCQLCGSNFKDETYLMPIHIISKGSNKRMQFILKNIVWGCNSCHKKYDEGTNKEKLLIRFKIGVLKKDEFVWLTLSRLYHDTPLLKDQNVKENLQKQIDELEMNK